MNSVGEIFGLDNIDLCLLFRSCLVAFRLRNRGDPYSNGMRGGVLVCCVKQSAPRRPPRWTRVRSRYVPLLITRYDKLRACSHCSNVEPVLNRDDHVCVRRLIKYSAVF